MMNKTKVLGSIVLPTLLLLAWGCAEEQRPRSYVQANVVQKALFEGEWYYRACVIRTNYEAGQMAFPGDCTADWINMAGGMSIPRIRWVIDHDYLVAIRAYEFVEGANVEWNPILGEPVLAFKIESHFDIRRQYNPVTGEEINVIEENVLDRPWYQREFMRVDWSQNLITTPELFMGALYGLFFDIYVREPAAFFVQEGSDSVGVQWPDRYRPRFVRTSAAEDAREGVTRVADYGGEGELYYMDFVTQEIFSPGFVEDPFTGERVPWCMSIYRDAPICTSSLITLRQSFLKVPPNRQYEAEQWPDSRQDQFGFWRLGRPTYDAGDVIHADDPVHGMTDFWKWPIGRFNIWQNWRDAAGNLLHPRDRTVRKTYFYTTTETPLHLLRPALRVVAEWNRYFMKLVRILKGQPLPSWDDGDAEDHRWVFDWESGGAYQCGGGEDVLGYCPPERRTEQAADRYDCRLAIDSRDHGPNVPTEVGPYAAYLSTTRRMEDFDADRFLAMEGDECVLVGRVNSCVRHPPGRDGPDDPGEPCEERGDLRYSFMSYVSHAATRWAGIAQMRSDPITGEYISGDANYGGAAMAGLRTRVLTEIDLETGRITEEEYYMGEHFREYIQNLTGLVERPAIPMWDEYPADADLNEMRALRETFSKITANMERAFARAQQLKGELGRRNTYRNRLESLVGTHIERLLFDHEEALAASDVAKLPAGTSAPGTVPRRLEVLSEFRRPLGERIADWERQEIRLAKAGVEQRQVFFDHTVSYFVRRLEEEYPGILDWERRPQLTFLVEALVYHPLMYHEFGHVLGLRHNFAGSADSTNYFPQYWAIIEENPLPSQTQFDRNRDGILDSMEQAQFARAQREVIRERELAGMKWWATASSMDYSANWYGALAGPSFDTAAMFAGYGDIIEVWDEDPGTTPRSDRSDVRYWKYYHGGEPCDTDDDCPFSANGRRAGELMPEQVEEGFTQKCTDWRTGYGHVVRACSNLRRDLRDARAAGSRFVDRQYKFASDDQVSYMGEANMFDEGANYREIIYNYRESWDRNYLRFAFRRYRYTFDYYPYIMSFFRHFMPAHKIFQEMFYKWAADIGDYRTSLEPFGFFDQYMASVEIMNWYTYNLTLPNVGTYRLERWRNRWRWWDSSTGAADDGIDIPLGAAKYAWSLYQGGLDGINRLERVGTFWEKLWTLQFMLDRWWGYGYTRDEPFFVNMYDLFPTEINDLVTAMLAGEPEKYMPRVRQERGQARLVYPMFWRGACLVDESEESACWERDTSLADLTPVESVSPYFFQLLAISYGLAFIPTTFDPSFQEQAQIYIVGTGAGASIPEGARECAPGQTENCEYTTYTSERFGKKYLAFRIERDARGTGGSSLGFSILQKAATQQRQLACLEQALVDAGGQWGGDCLRPADCGLAAQLAEERGCGVDARDYLRALAVLRGEAQFYDSYIPYVVEVQGRYGLNTWISYLGDW